MAILYAFLEFILKIGQFIKGVGAFFDKSGMRKHPHTLDDDIPEPEFKERLLRVGESLFDDLRSIDLRTNWSTKNFTSLEAEVEIISQNGRKQRKISDLLSAIKKSKDRLFLVLGDPGSGKSVSLRKLAQDLIKEINKTGKIPIYINLKEWNVNTKWSDENPPTLIEFENFIKSNIKSRDIVISKFFDKYYDRLYETGRLFFILDSFDEIPAVIDAKENSELIRILSEMLFKFLKGSRSNSSQGILSSRFFRKPTKEFQTNTILEIRPFDETRIIETLKKSGNYNRQLIIRLFKERADLIPIARNPFSVSLLSDFAEHNNNDLPQNQSDLYKSFISHTLYNCRDRILKYELTEQEIIDGAVEIANIMFVENLGFEVPISKMNDFLPNVEVLKIVDILKFSRIGRVGSGDENLFSFSHRRFCEYFAVQKLIKSKTKIDFLSIPKDSQWRDALVLYCEVADEMKAIEVAEYCWTTIKELKDTDNIEVIHCLRFLNDAFKGRLNCINGFKDELGKFIVSNIKPEINMIGVRFAVESVGLLDDKKKEESLISALEIGNEWISEIAFKSCRNLSSLNDSLETRLMIYLLHLKLLLFLKQWQSINFSLSLSQDLARVKDCISLRLASIIIASLCALICIIIYPYFLLILIFVFLLNLGLSKIKFYLLNSSRHETKLHDYLLSYFKTTVQLFTAWLLFLCFYPGKIYSVNSFIKMVFTNRNSLISDELIGIIFLIVFLLNLISLITLPYLIYFKRLVRNDVNYDQMQQLGKYFTIVFTIVFVFILSPYLEILVNYIPNEVLSLLIYVVYACEVLLFILSVILIFFALNIHYSSYKYFHSIIKNRLTQREYIFECYNGLKKSSYYKNKLINYLEVNVFEVTGKWPQNDILIARGSTFDIRLAKLDLKWRQLDS